MFELFMGLIIWLIEGTEKLLPYLIIAIPIALTILICQEVRKHKAIKAAREAEEARQKAIAEVERAATEMSKAFEDFRQSLADIMSTHNSAPAASEDNNEYDENEEAYWKQRTDFGPASIFECSCCGTKCQKPYEYCLSCKRKMTIVVSEPNVLSFQAPSSSYWIQRINGGKSETYECARCSLKSQIPSNYCPACGKYMTIVKFDKIKAR